MVSQLLCTIKEIAEFLRRPESTVRRWIPEMIEAKVVFYDQKGSPPRRMLCAYTDDVKEWHKKRTGS